MAKITLNDVDSGLNQKSIINSNNDTVETNLNDKVLYRNNPAGEANQMENLIDMNSNRIINVPTPVDAQDAATRDWVVDLVDSVTDGTIGITGPSSSGAGNVATYDGLTGQIIKDSGVSFYELGSTAASISHTGIVTGHVIETVYIDSGRVEGSGSLARFTGTTTVGKAGQWFGTSTDIYGYDALGQQFSLPLSATVKQFGAVGDGVTDDTTAIQLAFNQGSGEFPAGIYATTATLTVTVYPMVLQGPGGKDIGVTPALSNNTAMIYATGAQTHIVEWSSGGVAFENSGSAIDGVTFKSDNSVLNQHAIIFKKRMQSLTLRKVQFDNITGYGLAWDPTETNYGQNIALRDVTFNDVGGCLGLTAEPANSADYIACTLLTLDNVNLDGTINTVSPQTYLWDLRAFREIVASNFLTEGNNDVAGPDDVMVIGNNLWVLIDGWHNEWTVNDPTNYLTVQADPNNKFLHAPETIVEIRNISTDGAVLKIEDNTEPKVLLKGPSHYLGTDITDFVNLVTPTNSGRAPHVVIEDLQCKVPFASPEEVRGFIDLRSIIPRDVGYLISKGSTKLASWRPSDGSLLAYNSAFLAATNDAATIASSAIEADTTYSRILVQRATSNVNFASTFRWNVEIPAEFVGSLITFVIRYYQEVNVADAGTRFLIADTNDVQAPGQGGYNLEVQNEWATSVLTFAPSSTSPRVFSRFIGTTPTVAVITRIAALDIYLGSAYEEPLVLEHPDLLAPLGETLSKSVTLTTAQVNNCRGAPVELVAAPGTGKVLEFVSAVLFYDYTTTAFTVGADEDFVIQYDASTDVTASIESAGFIDQTNDEIRLIEPTWTITTDMVVLVNKKLEFFNTGAGETADGGTSTVKVTVNYRIHTTGL